MKNIILFLFFLAQLLFASEFEVNSNSKEINLLNGSLFYMDKNNKSFEEIICLKKHFKTYKKDSFNNAFIKENLWLHFKLTNNSKFNFEKSIYFDKPITNAITIYENSGGKWEKREFKNYKEFEHILNVVYDVEIKENSQIEFFVKFKSDISALNFSMILIDKSEVYKKEILRQLVLALFIGSIITFILYNFFIYIFTKEISYVYYICYFTTLLVYYAYYTNMYYYVIYEHFEYLGLYLLDLLVIFVLLFSKSFLKLKNYKKINLSFYVLISLLITIMIGTSTDFYPIDIVSCLLILVLIYVIALSYYLAYKQDRQAKYLLVGWTIALLGYIMFALYNFGFVSFLDYFPYFYEISIVCEALFFSMALSDKINKAKILEEAVQRNKILTKELHHRIKNNMQFIISMYRLKLSSHINDEISEKLLSIERTIQSMSKFHEMLYTQGELNNIDTRKYFESLIEELKNSFDFNGVFIEYNIKATISLEKCVSCGIILNELLSNSLKHALSKKVKIYIELTNKKDKTCFIVKDNGTGFKEEKISSKSFGLLLIKALVKNDLKGKIDIDSINKTEVRIVF